MLALDLNLLIHASVFSLFFASFSTVLLYISSSLNIFSKTFSVFPAVFLNSPL